jgi:uncharacterized protein HemX
MTQPDQDRAESGTRRSNRRPLRSSLLITLFSAIAFAASLYAVVRTQLSTTEAELAALAALATFGLMVYGLLQTLLTLVESASERRQRAREATERRHGDRAQKPG